MYQSAIRLYERSGKQKAVDCGRRSRRSSQADICSLSGRIRPSQIARILKEDKVITPTIHFQQTGRATRNAPPDTPYNWTGDTIADILERPEYQGHTVNFKTYKQSYKSKKKPVTIQRKNGLCSRIPHEAIIDADTWARVQELRKINAARRGQAKTNMFSGIVRCADCGEKAVLLHKQEL